MSGFPALRCFIFFAIDLFILPLPSFAHEASEYPGYELPLYTALSSLKWDESVLKPRKFRGIIVGFRKQVANH